MAWALGLGTAYYAVATLFQLSLAVLTLVSGRRDDARWGVALVLLASGGETLLLLGAEASWWAIQPGSWPRLTFNSLDLLVVVTLAYLFAILPATDVNPRRRRWMRALWVAALVVYPVLFLTAPNGGDPGTGRFFRWAVLHEGTFLVATVLLAWRFLPRWTRLDRGLLRDTTMVVGAALAMSPVYQGIRALADAHVGTAPWLDLSLRAGAVDHALLWTLGMVTVLALLFLLVTTILDPTREGWVLLGLLALPVLMGLRAPIVREGIFGEFTSQAVRPVLFSFAMLRYDLFQAPLWVRRVLVPLSGFSLALMVGLVSMILLLPEGLGATAIPPAAVVVGIAVPAILAIVLRNPIHDILVRSEAPHATRVDRVDRYRLALEDLRARGGADRHAVEVLRQRYGVTPEEHAVLQALLASDLVVPTATALQGAQPGSVVAGRYRVERELGRGGHTRALLARDRETGEPVVLKEVLRPWEAVADRRRASLRREAAVGERIRSAHLAPVRGLEVEGVNAYLVRDFVPGETLREHVVQNGPMAQDDAIRVILDVLSGLESLHNAGLLHLDVKPDNVVLTPEGRAILIDQGTVVRDPKAAVEGEDGGTLALEGPATGTLAWMAPEQVREGPLDTYTDVYAAAALLSYLLTGRPPVPASGRSRFQVAEAVVRGLRPPLPPDVKSPLRSVQRRALHPDALRRYPTVRSYRDALRNLG